MAAVMVFFTSLVRIAAHELSLYCVVALFLRVGVLRA
jgi:hypothetical protein